MEIHFSSYIIHIIFHKSKFIAILSIDPFIQWIGWYIDIESPIIVWIISILIRQIYNIISYPSFKRKSTLKGGNRSCLTEICKLIKLSIFVKNPISATRKSTIYAIHQPLS